MAERCNSCGAELFTGQQFCRACGTPTRQFSSEELPTQMLPHGQGQQQSATPPPLATSPLPGRETSDPVYGAGYSGYQPPPAPQRATAPVVAPFAPVRSGSRAWLYAVLGLLLFFAGASVVAGLFFLNRRTQRVVRMPARPNITVPVPAMPPPHPMDMSEKGTVISGEQSVITKTYPLAENGSFSLRNFSGDITVEGWDEQQAEVKIIRHGKGARAGDPLSVVREENGNRLVFNSSPDKPGGVGREVEYIVKLPRNLRELESSRPTRTLISPASTARRS